LTEFKDKTHRTQTRVSEKSASALDNLGEEVIVVENQIS